MALGSPKLVQDGMSKADIRLNFVLMLIDFTGYIFATSFLSFTTILPMFVRQLSTSDVLIGMIPAISSLGVFLPQVLAAPFVRRLRITKRYVVLFGLGERVPILFIAAAAWIWGETNKPLVLGLFFAFFAVMNFSTGVNFPTYFSLLSKALPSEMRGSLNGLGGAVGGLLGIFGAIASGAFLSRYAFPIGYVFCLAVGFLIFTLSLFPLWFVRERPVETPPEPKTTARFIRDLPGVLKEDKHFAAFVLSQILWAVGMTAQGFLTVYAVKELHATVTDVAVFNGIVMAVSVASNLVLGYAADRRGHKRIIQIATLASGAGALVAMYASGVPVMWASFALITVAMAGYNVSNMNIVLDFVPSEEVPTYLSLAGIATVPFRFLAPVIAGWFAASQGYWPIFLASGVASFLAWIVLMRGVPEPRSSRRMWT